MEIATDLKSSPVQPLPIKLAWLVHEDSGIRQHEVDALKRLIDSGYYHVNLDKLADRLLGEICS